MQCSKAQDLMDLYLADDPLLRREERLCLEGHLQGCPKCRATYAQGRQVIGLIRRYGQVSEETLALLNQSRARGVSSRPPWGQFTLHVGAVAACLAIVAVGGWVIAGRGGSVAPLREDEVALSGEPTTLTIASADGRHIVAGAMIQTVIGETKELLLNDRHQVVVNAGSKLAIQSLMERGRAGCLVNLALGEVYVHVEHDGNPFVVQTAHGRAVITGTTFDVKTDDAGTILVVAEGGVRLESRGNAVQVAAGQQSTIVAASETASTPIMCDVAGLIAWARPSRSTAKTAAIASPELCELPPSLPAAFSADLEEIDYVQWVEENRDWFRRQFPGIFRLKQALAREGMETDYPDLLLASGAIWQFAWSPAREDQLLPVDNATIITAAKQHGKDLQWLSDNRLLQDTRAPAVEQSSGAEAFALWQKELAAGLAVGEAVRAERLLGSLHACDYLRRTRSLIWLRAAEKHASSGMPTPHSQDLLQEAIAAAGVCTKDCLRLLTAEKLSLSCDSDLYRQLVRELQDGIEKMADTEERIVDEVAHRHP